MDLIGEFVSSLRRSLPDYELKTDFQCKAFIFSSKALNQVICIKYIQGKKCISLNRAHQYLEANRKAMQRKLGRAFYRKAYILNVLIADNLSKNCYELVSNPAKEKLRNMDMVFSTNRTSKEQIVATVLKALVRKFERWRDDILEGCRAKKVKKPYGHLKKKIKQIDDAIHELHMRISHYLSKVRGE